MSKTILVGGFGPGISTAVAEKFGAEGFSVALVGRSQERLDAGVKTLEGKGIKAAAFAGDLGNPDDARAIVGRVREKLGPITVLQWSAYSGAAGDLTTASTADIHGALGIAVTGFLAAVQAALPDLRKEKDAAILVTNGGLGFFDTQVDAMAVQWGAMGLAVANAAKHKIVRLLSQKLAPENVYVGEVMVTGAVKGTAFDSGNATIEARTVGEKFWSLYASRKELSVRVD